MNIEQLENQLKTIKQQLTSVQKAYWSEIDKLKNEIKKQVEKLIFDDKCFKDCELIPHIYDSYYLSGCEELQFKIGNIVIKNEISLGKFSIGFPQCIMYFNASSYENLVNFCKQTGIKISKNVIKYKKENIFNKMQVLKLEENNIKILEEII